MNAKQTLEKVQNELKRQTRQILTEVEVKSGTLRDRSFRVALELSENALTAAADVVGRVDVLEKPATSLRDEASRLREQQEALNKPPVDGYDTLNVKTITAALADMSTYDLTKVADYEKAHKNRKTVLREVERRLA